ncbi:hypothetical protein LCGC14_1761060, partial [marine sediment metagenome]
ISGSIASSQVSGSYTSITGVGALNAGSITSGFGDINIGTGNYFTGYAYLFVGNYNTPSGQTATIFDQSFVGPSVSGTGFQVRTWDIASMKVCAWFRSGQVLGAPTGADKGRGTLNVSGDIYKNNSAYTNPDYVFELAHDKSARKIPYGYRIRNLEEIEAYTRAWYHLPGTHYDHPMGMFDRGDWLLEKVEETFLHLIAHHYQLSDFERRFKNHDSRIARLEDENKELRELVTNLRN